MSKSLQDVVDGTRGCNHPNSDARVDVSSSIVLNVVMFSPLLQLSFFPLDGSIDDSGREAESWVMLELRS